MTALGSLFMLAACFCCTSCITSCSASAFVPSSSSTLSRGRASPAIIATSPAIAITNLSSSQQLAAKRRIKIAPKDIALQNTPDGGGIGGAATTPRAATALSMAMTPSLKTGGLVSPTVLSSTLTIMLAADLLAASLGVGRLGQILRSKRNISRNNNNRNNHNSKRTSRSTIAGSGSALRAASLEEASLYRPSFPTISFSTTHKSDGTTTYVTPALFAPTDHRPIVLFDGSCNLCNWGVQLLLDYDSCSEDERGNLRVAALQSRVGSVLLDRMDAKTRDMVLSSSSVASSTGENKDSDKEGNGEEEERYKSIVVCGPSQTWTNTAAILKMGRSMKFPFRPLALLAWLIPSFIRNVMYKWLSSNRKKLFGEREGECRLWDDNWDKRFVDDCLLGGKGSSRSDDNLFADPNAPPPPEEEEEANIVEEVELGETVRIVSPDPIVVKHVKEFPEGLCISGCIGKVAQKKPLVVEFDIAQLFGFEEESVEGEVGTFRAYVGRNQVAKV